MAPLTQAQESLLRERIQNARIVDGHAHNLVDPSSSSLPFLRCFSEAEGEALDLVPHTLSFKRSLRNLAELYGCNATLEDVQLLRGRLGIQKICSKCFGSSNISAVLIDDGLDFDNMYDLEWHRGVFPKVYRVLRIEKLAEDVLKKGLETGFRWTLDSFADRFVSSLRELSDKVIAFKSIAAYRAGLNIDPAVSKQNAEEDLEKCLKSGDGIRVKGKSLVDFIFICALEISTSLGIPMQIHTGFGDKDLDLQLANPLHLRSILEDKRFSNSCLVLLHASYPYSKEASYLASVYKQVYLDFGLAVPKLSVQGMRFAMSSLLELGPLNKVMFSTDGYAFPETFFLGIKCARETLSYVLGEACANGDLSFEEALQAADDIFGNNAINLYKLNDQLEANITQVSQPLNSFPSNGNRMMTKYVRLLWCDGSGQRRSRVVPAERFEKVTRFHGVGAAKCLMGMASHCDGPAEGSGFTSTGEMRLLPDLSTKCVLPWSLEEELCLVDMHSIPGSPWEYCPRSTLKRLSDILMEEFGLVMKAGFESEFYIVKKDLNKLDVTSYCSSESFDANSALLLQIAESLNSMGVNIEQLHAEAGGGQFEMAIHYGPCLEAADSLLLLRETVKSIVHRHGLLATFLPKFFKDDLGSGSHVHFSLWQAETNIMADANSEFGLSKIAQEFIAGVLFHLPSVLAFTCPHPNSYERIKPQTWAGAFQCWGNDNKEVPLRACFFPTATSCGITNFELKSFDGCANPHLGLAAIMAAGIDGLRKHLRLPPPIDTDPSTLSDGMVNKLPNSLGEVVAELEKNTILKESLGSALVQAITAIRRSDVEYFKTHESSSIMMASRY